MITYENLWETLKKKGMKKSDLLEILSPSTLSKIKNNGNITTDILDRICEFLNCEPMEVIKYKTQKDVAENVFNQLDEKTKKSIFEMLKESFQEGKNYIDEKNEEEFEEFKGKSITEKRNELKKEGKKKTSSILFDD